MIPATVLLIEPDPQTVDFLSPVLENVGLILLHAPTGKEGLISAWRDQVDVIISELDLPDIDGSDLIEKLRKDHRTRRTPIVLFTHVTNPALTAAALEAGADQVIHKQPGSVELLKAFLASASEGVDQQTPPGEKAVSGMLIAFLGIRGGAGTSTIAANTAHNLGLDHGHDQVVLVDLDLPLGSLKTITAASDAVDLAQLAEMQAGGAELKRELTAPRAWAMSLLAGVEHPRVADRIGSMQVGPVLQTLRNQFRFTLVDLGRGLGPLARSVIGLASHTVLVFNPDEAGVEQTRIVREALRGEGIPAHRISALSNRPYPTDSLTQRLVQDRLGKTLISAIPHMGDSIALANAMHVPLQLRFPDARGTAAVKEFAALLLERIQHAEHA